MIDTTLMRIFIRGTVINIKRGDSGVIYLSASAEKQYKTLWGRLAQYIAHALYRIADGLYPRHYDSLGLRVIQPMMRRPSVDDPLSNLGHHYVVECLPMHCSNGNADYVVLFINEGIEDIEDDFFASGGNELGRQQSTQYSHIKIPVNATVLKDDTP